MSNPDPELGPTLRAAIERDTSGAYQVTCPRCGAAPARPCRDPRGHIRPRHMQRRAAGTLWLTNGAR